MNFIEKNLEFVFFNNNVFQPIIDQGVVFSDDHWSEVQPSFVRKKIAHHVFLLSENTAKVFFTRSEGPLKIT
jgi:hypothetical protein